jgi:RNA polymerase sigma-70 factor (ECF subfamily)
MADERQSPSNTFRDNLIAEMPRLRAFSVSLCGSFHQADDLVQDVLLKAWTNADSFTEGTNMRAWLFTIARNAFYSLYRKRGREVQDVDGIYSANLAVAPTQDGIVELADFRIALAKLPDEQREVLVMVGASGLSYEQAAEICGVAVGTIKSRVNRARTKLGQLLGIDDVSDIGPDRHALSVVQPNAAAAMFA